MSTEQKYWKPKYKSEFEFLLDNAEGEDLIFYFDRLLGLPDFLELDSYFKVAIYRCLRCKKWDYLDKLIARFKVIKSK